MTRHDGYYTNRVRGVRRRREPPAGAAPPLVAEPVPLALGEACRRWAELLRQIFEVDPLRCPMCGAAMRIVAFITQRAVIDRILVARLRVETPRSCEETVSAIVSLIDAVERQSGERGAVGIGIPGAVVPDTGLVKNANSVWLTGRPLGRDLEA